MNIFIANDDGIDSIGLKALAKELSDIGNVYICAPDSERSANSHHFTLKGKMKLEEKEIEGAMKAYALDGTPCDCVRVGLFCLYKDIHFDLMVSGINRGWNVSSDLIYSGTIGAAREAHMNGIPAIAMSLNTFDDFDYSLPAQIAKEVVQKYLKDPKNKEYFLNVNVPALAIEDIKGYRICDRKGKIIYDEGYSLVEEDDMSYVQTGECIVTIDYGKEKERTDLDALDKGYVSIAPLYTDEIYHEQIEHFKTIYQ